MNNIIIEKYKEVHGLTDNQLKVLTEHQNEKHDPSLLTDSGLFVEKLHLYKDKKITIFPDYDADGVCGGMTLYCSLKILGFDAQLFYPDSSHGYGLNKESAENMLDQYPDTEIVITVDNGIVANEGVDYCLEKGIKTLISDHHAGQKELFPVNAEVVVDPNRVDKEENYPFHSISGTAVIWKLMCLYAKTYQSDKLEFIEQLETLVGISTITDVMPLIDENRTFVKNTVSTLKNKQLLVVQSEEDETHEAFKNIFEGLLLLLEEYSFTKNIQFKAFDDNTIGFFIGPILNTPRRMLGSSKLSFSLFTEPSESIVRNLIKLNDMRKSEVNKISIKVVPEHAIVIQDDNIKHGIAGLVASKLINKYKKPTIVLGKGFSGSGRSLDNLNLFDAIQSLNDKEYLKKWGGHSQAVGLTLKPEHFENFKNDLNAYFSTVEHIPVEPKYLIFNLDDIDMETFKEANRLFKKIAPFSEEFPKPIFKMEIPFNSVNISFIGKDKNHLRLQDENGLTILNWNGVDRYSEQNLSNKSKLELIGSFNINTFNGNQSLQFIADTINYK